MEVLQMNLKPTNFCKSARILHIVDRHTTKIPTPLKETNQDRWKTGEVRAVRKRSDESATGEEKRTDLASFRRDASSIVQKTGFPSRGNAASM